MKTGGSTALQSLRSTYPAGTLYPDGSVDVLIETKGAPQALFKLDEPRRSTLRCIAPHVPFSVAECFQQQSQRRIATTLVLRDGLERALSHLRQVARRFEYRYSYRQLLDLPLLGNFFFSDHQTRALSATAGDWPLWEQCFSALAMLDLHLENPSTSLPVQRIGDAEFSDAANALERIDVLGLQSNFDSWWLRCHQSFGWPEKPVAAVNVGSAQESAKAPEIPQDIVDELRERNRLDSQLYAVAKQLLEQQA